ncbi:MAG: aminomethyl-transferring glycine dehydrogenase subunit GcvPB [Spirochaetaceae bacterium]
MSVELKDMLIFERSREGRRGFKLPELDVPERPIEEYIEKTYMREMEAELPQVSEVDVIRHYTNLSHKNYAVDLGFYPLGSCTMKYNPKINEQTAALPGFSGLHPLQPQETVQGILELLYELTERLCEVTGMDWGTLQPFAGAHGEYTGMKFFRAYFNKRGEKQRTKVLVPDSAHGTNPASAHLAGFEVVEVKSNEKGMVSVEDLKQHLDENLAGIMLTNPNTLGLFEEDISEIAQLVHEAGGLLYYDGANLNAVMGKSRPGDMGFDVVHLNLHKTFSTPHGGGGPGSGAVMVKDTLVPFLPAPAVGKKGDTYILDKDIPDSIGRISGFYGNIAVLVRAYTYILTMGSDGLKEASELAVLNANYLKEKLKGRYLLPYDRLCKHEFVLSGQELKEKYGISAGDVAKGLLEFHIHAPTVYFPLVINEAMMFEPTETESRESLDNFISVMEKIADIAEKNPEELHEYPKSTPVRRVDQVQAAKHPVLRWRKEE